MCVEGAVGWVEEATQLCYSQTWKAVGSVVFALTFMPPMAANCSRIVGQSRTRVKKQRAGSESDGGLHQPPAGQTVLVFMHHHDQVMLQSLLRNLSPKRLFYV